jgi:outer membrane biosynthesis protein TonB
MDFHPIYLCCSILCFSIYSEIANDAYKKKVDIADLVRHNKRRILKMKSINKKITFLLITLIAISSIIIAQAQIVNGCTISNPCTATLSTDNAFIGQIAHYTLTLNNTGSANIINSNFTIPKGYTNLVSSSIIVNNNAGQVWTATVVTPPTLTSNGTIFLQSSAGGLSTNKTVTLIFTITNPSTANSYQWITKANLNTTFDKHDSQIYTIFLNQLITANPTPSTTPSPTATPSTTPSPTSSPSPTATPTPTLSPDPTQSPTSTPIPSTTPTPTTDSNPTTSPTPAPNPTGTPTLTETPSTPTPMQTTTQTITTTTTSSSSNSFTITFQQQGLPSGKSWNVTFNGVTKSATSATITFTGIKAGTYQWSTSRIINENENTRYEANAATSGSIRVSSASVQTIIYSTQYYLTVDSKYGNSTGEGWYTANAKAEFGITASTTQDLGKQYAFGGWTGTGTMSYTCLDGQSTIAMVGPVTETAKWEPTSTLYSVLLTAVIILVMMLLATFLALKRRKKKQEDD